MYHVIYFVLGKTAGSYWFLGVDIGGSCSVESSKRSCLKVSDIHILERSQISVNKFTAKDVWSHSCVLLCSRKNCWILLVSWWQVWLRGLKGVLLSLALWREDFWNPNNRTFARISLRWVQLSSTLVWFLSLSDIQGQWNSQSAKPWKHVQKKR